MHLSFAISVEEKEEMYANLEDAIERKDFTSLSYVRFDPIWDEVRGEARFQAFLKWLDEHLPPFDGRGWGIPYLEEY